MEAGLGSYACPCINVRIDLEKAESLTLNAQESAKVEGDVSANVALDNQNRLQEEVVVPRNKTAIQINVAQPLLTSRSIIQSPAFTKGQSVTALICLICDTTVYAVNKVQQSGSSRSVGFPTESTRGRTQIGSLSKADSPSPVRPGSTSAVEQDAILRPANGIGLMWIMSGCIFGSEAIDAVASSVSFSKSFGVVVADVTNPTISKEATTSTLPQNTSTRMRSDSDTRRSASPFRTLPLQSSSARRSAASPSPARRRRAQPLAEQEEEQGDDLDTLHLLENLLPHLPSSVVKEKANINGNSTSVRQMLSNTVQSSSDKFLTSQKQIEAKLDQIALGKLKEVRDKAQREIFAILKEKSNQINQLERQLRTEARQLRQKYVTHSTSRSDQSQKQQKSYQSNDGRDEFDLDESDDNDKESSSPLFIRRRPLVPVGLEKTASQDSDPSRRAGQIATGLGTSIVSPQSGNYTGPISGSLQGQTQIVGSALSASFAMRGRDLPGSVEQQKQRSKEEEEDWFAHKKRLRERYPNADHSALPSAVNSDDEETVQVKQRTQSANQSSDEEEEEERRGRGRGRAGERGHNKTPTPPSKNASKSAVAIESSGGANDAAKLDSVGVDQGGATKRGALKGASSGNLTHNGANAEKANASAEKKVAFANTTEEVEDASNRRNSTHKSKEPVEQVDPVFEIDEDMDADDTTPNASDITLDPSTTALKESAKEIMERDLSEEQVGSQGNEDSQYVGSVIQTLPVVGSFAAMAESESRGGRILSNIRNNAIPQEREEENDAFDPASLRFDGRTIYNADLSSSVPRASSHSDRLQVDKQGPSAKSLQMIAAQQALFSGFPADDLQRSSIGFRVMVGEAEARLSGLLAPNAPSHRDLWSNKKRAKSSSVKYVLEGLPEEEDLAVDNEIIEAKKEKENTKSINVKSSIQAKEAADDFMLARSVPINMRNSFAGRSFSSIHRDSTSGFDLEPKTSLPYQEKKMTPSLLKATRQYGTTRIQRRPSLGTISDSSEKPASIDAGSGVQEVVPGKPEDGQKITENRASVPIRSKTATSSTNLASSRRGSIDLKYTVPSSVTRGFDVGGSSSPLPSVAKIATGAIDSAHSSPMLGSSAGTGRSSRVRSPRPPYVAPPPPESTSMRLSPDAAHRPNAWTLAPAKEADTLDEDELEGDLKEVLKFMHTVEHLKTKKRTGWYHHRIDQPESIADHMYRMAVLSMLLPDHNLDIGKCVQLCLVHDLAEALTGDITPLDKVTKEEKLKREKEAIEEIVDGQLAGSKAGKRILDLWNEYEDRETIESKTVKDLDRFELALQGVEYEERFQTTDLQPFYDQSAQIQHPRVQRWIRALSKQREELWKNSPYGYTQTFPKDEVALTPWETTQS